MSTIVCIEEYKENYGLITVSRTLLWIFPSILLLKYIYEIDKENEYKLKIVLFYLLV